MLVVRKIAICSTVKSYSQSGECMTSERECTKGNRYVLSRKGASLEGILNKDDLTVSFCRSPPVLLHRFFDLGVDVEGFEHVFDGSFHFAFQAVVVFEQVNHLAIINEEGLRMKSIWFNRDLDLIIVLLNNKKLLKRPISDFKRMANATEEQLNHFENDGIGIHWLELNEDSSLRGFLKYELAKMDTPWVA